MRSVLIVCALCLLPATARAGGFELAEHGAAGTGMAGAFVAKADDASAVFFNPSGLADQRGLQLYLGTTLITAMPSAQVASGGQQDAATAVQPIPTIYASYGLPHQVTLGVGAFTNFGLSLDWPHDWAGRYLIRSVALTTVTINPTAAWRPLPWLAVGGGIDITPASADLSQAINLVAAEANARFRGNAVGVSGNLGVLATLPQMGVVPPLSVGVSYRSRYDLSFDNGSIQVDAPPELAGMLHDSKASSTLPIPDVIAAGVGAYVRPRPFLQAQVDWTHWARFKELRLTAPDNPLLNMAIPEQWHDGWVLRVGGEYAFEKLRVRAGVGYDWNPIPSATLGPIVPDSDRFFFAGGFSLDLPSHLTAELALMAVLFQERQSALPQFPARYSTFALLTGLSLHYHSSR